MANKIVLGNFSTILSRTKKVLAQGKQVTDPFLGATSIDIFKQTVADGRRLLPTRYQAPYVDVLDAVVKQAEFVLLTLHPRDGAGRRAVFEQLQGVFSILAAPIVQLRSKQHERELKAFLAEISNIYRRFVNDDQVQRGSKFKILSPDLDPLGAFGHDASGPFTLSATPDMPVAIVSKPSNEINFLPLWAADGHEVGGHDIYGAVEGFEDELEAALEANLRAAFKSGRIKTSSPTVTLPGTVGWWFWRRKKTVSMEDFMVRVWKSWHTEASSDHAGLVNLGPMYLDSLMLLLCALRGNDKLWPLGMYDSKLFSSNGGFEEHPIDVVRALLAVEALKLLDFSDGQAYADAFTARIKSICGGALPATVFWLDRKQNRVIDVALSDFQAVLPVVAETMLKHKLTALAGQSFGEIINWLDEDERIVQAVAVKLANGDSDLSDEVEARHVVAASMLALETASASGRDISQISALVHDTGITMLKDMYDEQCLLCSISSAASAPTPEVDMGRLFKHIKSR
jgi:hypothetical protein